MAVKAPNDTHLHPYLGKPTLERICHTPPRQLCLWQMSCGASFSSSAPVNSGCRVGDRASPEPAAAFHLLARSTCFGLRCHLYMHSHRLYPAGSKNLSHLTQPLQQLLINNRGATFSPCEEAEDLPFLQQTYGIFFIWHKLWSVFRTEQCLATVSCETLHMNLFNFFWDFHSKPLRPASKQKTTFIAEGVPPLFASWTVTTTQPWCLFL